MTERDSSALGVAADRVYLDVGLTGMAAPRPAMREALAAARGGDTLMVTGLGRLARSVPDACELLDRLAFGEVTLVIGDGRYPPSWPLTRVLGETLALTAQWRSGGGSWRTRAGLAAARTRGQLTGRTPKLTDRQQRHVASSIGQTVTQSARSVSCSPCRAPPSTALCGAPPDSPCRFHRH